ncbi:hypothetical protein OC846_002332 [Tilletia horrida]|uniref:Small ribosomal subunit protein mS41 n=1 Tax=Tilletia horrida TaxID=155126 RepID=A0AAN6GTW7_9BASI|nr:hypothetical protein OC845_001431 [Tilletia horrida]KAK0553935.1 hypothetical protein OC846_002332 [Tilletia horrida]KAK0567489.1 hypothetical protein OC861_002712 [Tilletia horrida]
MSSSASAQFTASRPSQSTAGLSRQQQSKKQSVQKVVIPTPTNTVNDPRSFLEAISRGPRRNLQDNSAAVTALGDSWEAMWQKVLTVPNSSGAGESKDGAAAGGNSASVQVSTAESSTDGDVSARAGKQINKDLRAGGVTVKDRRYILWALEKYRQGQDPAKFSIGVKPKKTIRGWGPRVQNGVRVRGRRRPGEK